MPIANDPLSLVFMGCFLFGLLFLLATALLGNLGHGHSLGHGHVVHLHHGVPHSHSGPAHKGHTPSGRGTGTHTTGGGSFFSLIFSYINLFSLVLFLFGFGFFGYLFHTITSFTLPLTLSFATIGGLVIATALIIMINRLFGDSEGATIQDVTDRTGLLGKVSITIQPQGLGEIIYVSPGGMRKSIPARSIDGQRLERDQEVIVVNYQHGVAEVDTWDHFVNQDETEMATGEGINDLTTLQALLEETHPNTTEYVMQKEVNKE